jgi:hypothetical protein
MTMRTFYISVTLILWVSLAAAQAPETCTVSGSMVTCFSAAGSRTFPLPAPVTITPGPAPIFDAAALKQQLLALEQQLTRMEAKIDSPPWLQKVLTHPITMALEAAVGVWVTCNRTKKC